MRDLIEEYGLTITYMLFAIGCIFAFSKVLNFVISGGIWNGWFA